MTGIYFPQNLVQTQEGFYLSTLTLGMFHYAGSSWTAINEGLPSLSINDFKFHHNVLYAGTDQGFFKRGVSESAWTKITFASDDTGIRFIQVTDSFMMVSTTDFNSYISYNGGVEWRKIPELNNVIVYDIHFQNDKIYAGSFSELFVSDDMGATWTKYSVGNIFVDAMIIQDNIIYLGTLENGIWAAPLHQPQQIVGFALAEKKFGDAPFKLEAAASSGLPVIFTSSDNSVVTVTGDIATIVGTGSATIKVKQSGNMFFNAATAEGTLTILVLGIETMAEESNKIFPNPGHGDYVVEAPAKILENQISVVDIYGRPANITISRDSNRAQVHFVEPVEGQFILLLKSGNKLVSQKFINTVNH